MTNCWEYEQKLTNMSIQGTLSTCPPLFMHTPTSFPHFAQTRHRMTCNDIGYRLHACAVGSYSLLSVLGGGIASVGGRGRVGVRVCRGVGDTPRAEFFQRAGSSDGSHHQTRLSLQVEALQVTHHRVAAHLQHFEAYFPLELAWEGGLRG